MNSTSKSYYGIANELDPSDPRLDEYRKQREERGFDDTELWSLDITLTKFLAPRLEELIKQQKEMFEESYPGYWNELETLHAALIGYDTNDGKYLETIKTLLPKVFIKLWI